MSTLYKYLTGGREVTYLDADDAYQPEDIRSHWAGTFPELGNASTDIDQKKQTVTHEGNEVEVDRVVSFAKKVGTKGMWFPDPLGAFLDIVKTISPFHETVELEPDGRTPYHHVQEELGGKKRGRDGWWVYCADDDVIRAHRRKRE